MEKVREYTYLGDRVSAGGGCEVAVIANGNNDGFHLGNVVNYCMKINFL